VVASPTGDLDRGLRQELHDLSSVFPRVVYVTEDPALNVVQVNQVLLLGRPTYEVQNKLLSPSRRLIKRLTDLALCLLGLSIGVPVFACLAMLIALDSPGHVLYKQRRVGLDGSCLIFSSPATRAEEALDVRWPAIKAAGEVHSPATSCRRITDHKVGKLLRRFSFDEFPQFLNVIRERGIVGTAYLPSEIEQLGEAREVILRVPPGLTGWWQVMGRHRLDSQRLRMDEFYVGNYSMLTDLYIMCKTVYVVIAGEGI
jgi:undecaprenyl-phosphate galactose phosphotransferase